MQLAYSLDQLLVLEAIIEKGSFAKAAQSLYRVPSAVSYSVRSLEDSLGFEIFDRSKRKAVLSSNGRKFYQESLELLEKARNLQSLANHLKSGWEAEIQIVIDGILPMYPITDALRTLSEQKVPTQIRVDIEYQEGVPERFFNDKADMMLLLDFEDDSGTLEAFQLPPLEVLLVGSPDHPLSSIKLEEEVDISHYIELVVRDSASQYNRVPKTSFLGSKNKVYLSDFHSKRLALLSATGFGWMPRYLIQKDLDENQLVHLNFREPNQWTYNPWLVKMKNRRLGKASQLFRKSLLHSIDQKN
jgi:DNA-binding transcriptional LysR family regulator